MSAKCRRTWQVGDNGATGLLSRLREACIASDMNYRHGFHAGNFADVFKHVLLARLLLYLAHKETPFRVIDTHAGEGAYDLSSDEAERTGEWRTGVGRIADLTTAPSKARDLLQPYLDCLGPIGPEGRPAIYPGSPVIAQRLMRAQDKAIFCELRPDAFTALRRRFGRDARIKTIHLDGYVGLGGFVPPKERRGLVLIDPPFERTDEFDALFYAFCNSYRKWPTGIYALWYPSKCPDDSAWLHRRLREEDIPAVLALSLRVGAEDTGLQATGLVVVNPPFGFTEEASVLLEFLAKALARDGAAKAGLEWLTPKR